MKASNIFIYGFIALLITGLVFISGCVSNGDNEETIPQETGSADTSADAGEAGVSVANESNTEAGESAAGTVDDNDNNVNAGDKQVSNADKPESEILKENLDILGYHDELYENDPAFTDGFWVVGKAVNAGNKTIKNAKIIVNFYDEDGDLLETGYDALDEWEDEDGYPLTLEPDYVWEFEARYPNKNYNKIDKYEVFVDFVELK